MLKTELAKCVQKSCVKWQYIRQYKYDIDSTYKW